MLFERKNVEFVINLACTLYMQCYFQMAKNSKGHKIRLSPCLLISYQQLGKTFQNFLIRILMGIKFEEKGFQTKLKNI